MILTTCPVNILDSANLCSAGEAKDKSSTLSTATKDAELKMGKVDIGGCRIEVDDIRQVST
jgi:hypothetical protein